MKRIIICLALILLFTSCTIRVYDINYNYYVGNNIAGEPADAEKTNVGTSNVPAIEIPQGSGNLYIYVQAEVPKHINLNAEAELNTPLIGR